ncbi:mechanosensitive ion channel family protein [Marinicella rhabdoformis]|uniref:mechanosensitive ion channel family protein n=1 Tax=Marinicella rhabdoformis TaxID=2580566 RepID=UPI0012AED01D|nr:mechanosensitive ion channel family protein [Marinicella rhabdoformis]
MHQEDGKANTQETPATENAANEVPDVTAVIEGIESYLPESMQGYWQQIQDVPFVGFFVLLALGYLFAKIGIWLFSKVTMQLTKRTKTDLDDHLIDVLRKPMFLTVFLFFMGMGVKTLGLSASMETNLIRILASIVAFTWMMRGFRVLHLLLDSLSRVKNKYEIIQPKTIPLFELVGKLLLIGLGSYVLLLVWGINPTAWLASAGVVGIAVGFAAKDTLANLFSGFFIIADSPYKVGDFVILSSGERGEVTHVGIRSTRLLTRDDIEITVPNNVIGNAKIVNESSGRWEKSRIRVKVGAAYGSDLKQVCDVLVKVAQSHSEVLQDPAPRVRMREFGASSLDFELLAWIAQPVLRGRMRHELHMAVYDAFNEAGIEIPYAKQDLYIKEFPHPKQDSQN